MKTLLLMRHAKSSWDDETLSDHQRPLNRRGLAAAPRMGRFLQEQSLLPDLILASTAERARHTAELVAEASGFAGDLHEYDDLYHAGPHQFLTVLANIEGEYDRVLVVAHNPGSEELIELLTGKHERMPTAALAQISLSIDSWSEINGRTSSTLEDVWRPKELD